MVKHLGDGLRGAQRQGWNILAKVDGHIDFAVRLIRSNGRARKLLQRLIGQCMQPRHVALSCRIILRINPLHALGLRVVAEIERTIFTHHAIHRPHARDVITPPGRATL